VTVGSGLINISSSRLPISTSFISSASESPFSETDYSSSILNLCVLSYSYFRGSKILPKYKEKVTAASFPEGSIIPCKSCYKVS